MSKAASVNIEPRPSAGLSRVMPMLSGLLALAVLASLLWGAGEVGPARALAVLAGHGDSEARFVVETLRLPRTLIGIAVGLSLGVAGALLQAVSRNPLAEPGLLGVSAGAAFAVAVALWLGASAATCAWPWPRSVPWAAASR